jgi:hypothetical protein
MGRRCFRQFHFAMSLLNEVISADARAGHVRDNQAAAAELGQTVDKCTCLLLVLNFDCERNVSLLSRGEGMNFNSVVYSER